MGAGATPPIPLDVLPQGTWSGRRGWLTGFSYEDRSREPLRAAFMGRTSTEDRQDPTLSIPRQVDSCRAALPEQAVIVAHYYDIESGRKALGARGRGHGHEGFAISVPREGGIQDLLERAAGPRRGFDVVICESIERIARRTYIGTLIENRLEEAGVPLLAADEPFTLTGRRATQVLTRRVKQSIAEWYVLDLLEKSWGGLQTHTEQGYNVGKPPYGYLAEKIPHPVPARRAEGACKHRLRPDPVRGPVVTQLFAWRVAERLGYKALAERLNQDLDRYPPPIPVDPSRALGRWTPSSIRDVLTNPKHTGYMVWNRRATTSDTGRNNPPEAWVWSSAPTHEPLVTKDCFIEAQKVATLRQRSRNVGGVSSHPDAKRTYSLRSFLFCAWCGRRMNGKTRRGTVYYVCAPPKGYAPEGHPNTIWLREALIVAELSDLLAANVLGPQRSRHLDSASGDAVARVGSTKPTSDRASPIPHRSVADQDQAAHQPELPDAPTSRRIQLDLVPDAYRRRLFEALRLKIDFDQRTRTCRVQITLA
ncbi:recombinase family protein [Actinomadura violacea]|uniref:Recombinase family protein n=1 Tax=Actinomadura violacea TaxID=2819934 RepID=A0ABS3RNK0_9ACTN|nr:recombinase family protein [Actinomadura violacea]MBO2458133.1 recombinase family protein [Actinomadura violacea]